MAIESKITSFLNRRHWIIPVLFSIMCALLLSSIVSVEIVGVNNLAAPFSFNIACELLAMFVGTTIVLSIVPTYKRQTGYIRIFVTLVFFLCFTMAFDIAQALIDGNPNLIVLNKIVTAVVFISEANVMFFFWIYATYVLKSKGKIIGVLNMIAAGLVVVFTVLPIVNIFVPFYFYFDADAVYHRMDVTWEIFARSFHLYIALITVVAIFLSKEKIKTKIIIFAFIGLPIISLFTREMKTGTAIEYGAMMVSTVLMYASLFAGRERELYSTSRELGLATNIQKHMLPSIFPAFPERKEFDVYALMDTAKEVGGDFYDFFLIDETHLGLVMADVSDKGVPAALFMMASKIMVQNYALMGLSPKEVLTKVNRQICANHQEEMFVTVWFGVLDLKTGVITASNGGHERPIIKQPDGHFEILNDKHNLVVGFVEDAKYSEYKIRLKEGAKLFLYTDGVPEARNDQGQFGMNRTLESLVKHEDESADQICKSLLTDLSAFTGEVTQFDDITMLCLEYHGYSNEVHHLNIKATIKEVPVAINQVMDFLRKEEVDHKTLYKIEVALEELLTNVASYAYGEEAGNIDIEYEILPAPKTLIVTIMDEGKPFNPLLTDDPDIDAPIEERSVGGLGLYIVKNTMDEMKYDRKNNKNVLIIKKRI